MVMEIKEQIIQEIQNYIASKGNQKSNWLVRITNTPSKMFNESALNKDDGSWIYITADTNEAAINIQNYLINDGLIGDGKIISDDYKIVFAYKKNL